MISQWILWLDDQGLCAIRVYRNIDDRIDTMSTIAQAALLCGNLNKKCRDCTVFVCICYRSAPNDRTTNLLIILKIIFITVLIHQLIYPKYISKACLTNISIFYSIIKKGH